MAVTANQLITRTDGCKVGVPVAASTTIYQGTLTFINSTGYLDDDTASGVNAFAGVAIENKDNSAGSAGDLTGEIWVDGAFDLVGSGFTQADVGKDVFAADNYVINLTDAANSVKLGRCVEFVSTTVLRVKLHSSLAEAQVVDSVDVNGKADAIILDADADTTISSPTDDQIDVEVGGTDRLTVTSAGIVMNGTAVIDLAGGADALVLDADNDTTISSPTADTIESEVGGADVIVVTATAITLADAVNIAANATTGTKLGTAVTQKLAFWNTTPVVQPASADQADQGAMTTVGANTGTAGAGLSVIGNTTSVDQAANLMNDLLAIQEDITALDTLVTAIRTAL